MRWRKWYTVLLIILTLLIGLGSFLGNYILPYGIIVPLRAEPSKELDRFPDGIHPTDLGLDYDSIALVVEDTITLYGYWLHAADSAKGAIIMLHGISDAKESMLGLGQWLTQIGWDAILMDLRAHGDSEGKFNTYGFYEKEDVRAVVDHVKAVDPKMKIGIYGNSLGGAIAYQALAVEPRLAFGLIQSTFSHLPDIIAAYQKQYSFGIEFPETTRKALAKAGRIAKFPIFDIHPAQVATQVHQPIMVIHGLADENIDPSLGRENFDSLASEVKYWVPVEEADHYNVHKVGGTALQDTISWFLGQVSDNF